MHTVWLRLTHSVLKTTATVAVDLYLGCNRSPCGLDYTMIGLQLLQAYALMHMP